MDPAATFSPRAKMFQKLFFSASLKLVFFNIAEHLSNLLRSCVFDFSELGVLLLRTCLLACSPPPLILCSTHFSERTCESNSVSQESHNSSCRKVRSSGTSAGNPPPLGLGDLTLWQEKLCDSWETLLLSHVARFFHFFLADFRLAGVTIKSSQTAESETRVAETRLPDS